MNLKDISREKLFRTIGYYITFISLGLATVIIGPTLPDLAAQTNSTLDTISIIFTANSLGFLAGSYFGGRLYDLVPGHPLIAGALVTSAISLALMPFVSSLWLLSALFFILGAVLSAIDLGTNTLIVWNLGDRVAPFMNALHFFFGIGAALSPIIVAKAVQWTDSIQWAFWTIAILMLPPILFLLFRSSPKMRENANQSNANHANGRSSILLILLISLFFFLYCGGEGGFGNWIYTYLIESDIDITQQNAYLLTSVFWAMLTVGRLVSIPIAAWLKTSTILIVDLIGTVIAIFLIFLFPTSVPMLWIGTILLGFAFASMFPTALVYAEDNLGITGKITSYFYIGIGLANMFIPWLIGQRFDLKGPKVVINIIFIVIVLNVANFIVLEFSNKVRKKNA